MLDLQSCKMMRPKIVAVARDNNIVKKEEFPDSFALPACVRPVFGNDITYSLNKRIPYGYGVGSNEKDLKEKMRKLIKAFSYNGDIDLVSSIFDSFLVKNKTVGIFSDSRLDTMAGKHPNIKSFCDNALSKPSNKVSCDMSTFLPRCESISPTRPRIHQALKNADWNIENITIPIDLGVPAFNKGSTIFHTKDYSNGLGLMVNSIQYVYIFATNYKYEASKGEYVISLDFIFYDVFGLDDEDLRVYGARKSDSMLEFDEQRGITAWWQLQHQYGYAPLVTRFKVSRTYRVKV